MSIKFSVLMSVYKNEKADYLRSAIESVFNNSVPPSELVLVVDGPIGTELQTTIDALIHDKNIIIVKSEVNIGLGRALNLGLKACQHDYVARMDTDDICVYERFEKQLAYINENPDVVLLGGNVAEFDKDMKTVTGIRRVVASDSDIRKQARCKNPFNHMSVMFKKDPILKLGGYKHHFLMEDYNLWLRVMANNYAVANLDDILVHVRAGLGMISRRRGLSYIKSEHKLAKVKIKTGIDSVPHAWLMFAVRGGVRLLPSYFLSKLYFFMRKKG